MKRLFLWVTLALILLTNAFILSGVAYNRTAEPEATITLTEREANLSYSTEENSGIALHLLWQQDRPYWPERDPGWFNQAKLESLGYDCSVPLTDVSAYQHYRKALPRKAYVVLEYDGKSWNDWFAGQKAKLLSGTRKSYRGVKEEIENLEKTASRLVAIDVGNDAARLRGLYPDRTRFLIAPAEVHLVFMNELIGEARKYQKPFIYGHVSLLNQEVYVPLGLSEWLDQILKAEQRDEKKSKRIKEGPRYNVILQYGRRYEPWVVDIKPMTERL